MTLSIPDVTMEDTNQKQYNYSSYHLLLEVKDKTVLFIVHFLLFNSRLLTGIPSEILSGKNSEYTFRHAVSWLSVNNWPGNHIVCWIINTEGALFTVLKQN